MYNSENWKDYSDSSQILMSFPSSYIAKETFKKGLKQNKFKMRHETDAANIKPVIRDYVSLCQYFCIVRKTNKRVTTNIYNQ